MQGIIDDLGEKMRPSNQFAVHPLMAVPSVMTNGDGVVFQIELEESGRAEAGLIVEQGSAGVEAKLVGKLGGKKRPSGVDVTATVQMRTERRQPST